MSPEELSPKTDQSSDPSPPKKPTIKFQVLAKDLGLKTPELLNPIPTIDNVILSHPIQVKLGPSHITIEKVPANKYVLLFGVQNRQSAKAYKEAYAKTRYLSLSEEEDTVMRAQGLGLSIFRAAVGQPLNPSLTDGNTGLVVFGSYADRSATVEQRATFAKSIAPVVEE